MTLEQTVIDRTKEIDELTIEVQKLHAAYSKWATDNPTDLRNHASLCGATRKLQIAAQDLLETINKLHGQQINVDMIKAFRDVNSTLPAKSRTNNIGNGYGTFRLIQRTSFSPLDKSREAKERLYAWMKKNGMGALLKVNVPANTLSAALRAYSNDKGRDPPPDVAKKNAHSQIEVRLKGYEKDEQQTAVDEN